ncbi:MAG: TetR/AcrR family transcriptional regulator [Acidobacteriota bacterium]
MRRTRKDVITEFRTGEILAAAHAVFARKGFQKATISDVARAAGVAKGTVYLYYPSKRAVYWAAFRRDLIALRDRTHAAMAAASDIRGVIAAFVRTKVGYFDEHRDFMRIYFSEFGVAAVGQGELQRHFDDLYHDQIERLTAAFVDATARGAIRDLPAATLAAAVFDLTRGVIRGRMLGLSRGSADDDAAMVVDLVWRGIGKK